MKTSYAPDNTRSTVVVVLLIAIAACLIAVLVGLSDKPDVTTIGVMAGSSSAPVLTNPTEAADAAAALSLDESGQPFDDIAADGTAMADAGDTGSDTTDDGTDSTTLAAPVATAEPTPTPEVAAAVAPTPAPSAAPTVDAASVTGLRASGSVQGAFFTRPDEENGATVAQNSITVSFAEDGSGSFTATLDITYADTTEVKLRMSGPLEWSPAPPQVEATVTGTFSIDAPLATDDVTADEAELSITSLESGSGSLCATKCFGFTFPPQTGL